MITEEGMAITAPATTFRNNIKQFSAWPCPKTPRWVRGGGRQGGETRPWRKGAVLIPLFKSVETGRVLDAFRTGLWSPPRKAPCFTENTR